jgi:hypothetical protein
VLFVRTDSPVHGKPGNTTGPTKKIFSGVSPWRKERWLDSSSEQRIVIVWQPAAKAAKLYMRRLKMKKQFVLIVFGILALVALVFGYTHRANAESILFNSSSRLSCSTASV